MLPFSAANPPSLSTGHGKRHILPLNWGPARIGNSGTGRQCIGNPLPWPQNIVSIPASLLWSYYQSLPFPSFASERHLPLPAAIEDNSNYLFLRVHPQIYTTGELSKFPHPAHKTHGMAEHLHPDM